MLETIVALVVVGVAVAGLAALLVVVLRVRDVPVGGTPGRGSLSDDELERLLGEGRDE